MTYENWAIHTPEEIERIAAAADILSRLFGELAPYVVPGMSTMELEERAEAFIRAEGAEPAFKGYRPPFENKTYPYTLCISIDDQIVHGLPGPARILQKGQIVSIDCGVRLEGMHADMAYTFAVGEIPPPLQRLLWVTQRALERGIQQAQVGAPLGNIGHAIYTFVKSYTFAVSEQLTGHGVGRAMHMEPEVPNIGKAGKGPRLRENLVLAIEPMVQMGTPRTRRGSDGWAICTYDGKPAAHYEHTIVVEKRGPRILTSFEPIYKALAHV